MWRAGYTLVDLLGRGLRHGGDDWPSIRVCWAPRVARDTENACDERLVRGQRPGDRASCLGEGTTGTHKCIEQCADVSDRAVKMRFSLRGKRRAVVGPVQAGLWNEDHDAWCARRDCVRLWLGPSNAFGGIAYACMLLQMSVSVAGMTCGQVG